MMVASRGDGSAATSTVGCPSASLRATAPPRLRSASISTQVFDISSQHLEARFAVRRRRTETCWSVPLARSVKNFIIWTNKP